MALICGRPATRSALFSVPFIAINYLYIQLFFYLCWRKLVSCCRLPVACCQWSLIVLESGVQLPALFVCPICFFFVFFLAFLLPNGKWLSWPGPIKCDWMTGCKPSARCTLQLTHKSNLINRGQSTKKMPDAKKMVSFINYWLRPLSEDYAYAVCLLFVNTFCREYFALGHSILIICKISLNVSTCVQMRVLFRTFVASRESNTHTRTQSLKIFTFFKIVFLAGGCHVLSSHVFMGFPQHFLVSLYGVFLEIAGISFLCSLSDLYCTCQARNGFTF